MQTIQFLIVNFPVTLPPLFSPTLGQIINLHNFTKKYHVFAPMGKFQLELIYLYFPSSSHLVYLQYIYTEQKHTYTRWDDGGK